MPAIGKKAVLHPHSQSVASPRPHASTPNPSSNDQIPPSIDSVIGGVTTGAGAGAGAGATMSQMSHPGGSGASVSSSYGDDLETRASHTISALPAGDSSTFPTHPHHPSHHQGAPSFGNNNSNGNGNYPTRAASGPGNFRPIMPTLYLEDSSFALPFRVTLPHGGLRPLGQSAAAYEVRHLSPGHTLPTLP